MWFEEVMKKKRKTSPCCYRKVNARYKGVNSAYRSGAFVRCENVGCENWGNSVKKEQSDLEDKEQLHGWFKRRGGKETKDGKTQGGWIACSSCENKNGPKPCGRKDASKGTKRKCRPTCSACKNHRRKGKKRK